MNRPYTGLTDRIFLFYQLFWLQLRVLKRHSQKSLPTYLFQREERLFAGIQ